MPETYMPTPTQAENDQTATGNLPIKKDYDGSPIDPSSNDPIGARSAWRADAHVARAKHRPAAKRAGCRCRSRHKLHQLPQR